MTEPFRHQPPWQEPPEQPPAAYVITKPGGLSGTAHAVHILICLLSCGLWIPGYILFMAAAPAQRQEVIHPFGTPVPGPVVGVPRPLPESMRLTPEQIRVGNRRVARQLAVVGAALVVAIGLVVLVAALS